MLEEEEEDNEELEEEGEDGSLRKKNAAEAVGVAASRTSARARLALLLASSHG